MATRGAYGNGENKLHIFLDSNIYAADFRMKGINFQNLFSYVRRTKAHMVLTRLVREESVALHRTRLEKAGHEAIRCGTTYKKLLIDEDIRELETPDYKHQSREYRKLLREPAKGVTITNLVETEGVDITEVFLRGIHRKRPANINGEELRDVILWLSILAFAKKENATVAFLTNDSGFWDDDQLADQIKADITESGAEVSIFKSIDSFITKNSLESSRLSFEDADRLIDIDAQREDVTRAMRQALEEKYRGYRGSSNYNLGEMRLITSSFSSGLIYLVESATEFAEARYDVELEWEHSRSYPNLAIGESFPSGGISFMPSRSAFGWSANEQQLNEFENDSVFGSPVNVWGASGGPVSKEYVSKQLEKISATVLVLARIEENSLKEFEVHEVTIKDIKRM